MNRMILNGRTVRCETTPRIVRDCGFHTPDEVHDAAMKYGQLVAGMRTEDVAD